MNQSNSIFRSIFIVSLIFVCSAFIYGQQVEPSYDISLQLVIGSNETGQQSRLPAELTNVTRQLKTRFAFSDYRLASTFFGRISNTGTFQYQSVANIFGKESISGTPTFLDWSLVDFRKMPAATGQTHFQAQSLKFGAKVPVVTGTHEENGKSTPSINYEPIGLNLSKIGFPENFPTLIGTLNLPGTSGTIFLIMTVRSAD